LLLALILFSTGGTLSAQTYSSLIKDKEIHDFLNWLIRNEKISTEEDTEPEARIVLDRIGSWDTTLIQSWNPGYRQKSDSLRHSKPYTKITTDTLMIGGQVLVLSDTLWRPAFTRIVNMLPEAVDSLFMGSEREFLKQQLGAFKGSAWHGNFTDASLTDSIKKDSIVRCYAVPLFSRDRQYVMVSRIDYCSLPMCASGSVDVYRRISEGKWEYVANLATWFS
jgi:hypothetical protein